MKENFKRSFIAFPIQDSSLLRFIEPLNPHKKFYHMTLFFLGNVDDRKLEFIKQVLASNFDAFRNIDLVPDSLATIGLNKKTYVLTLRDDEALKNIRDIFEKNLPEFVPQNLPFKPHVTIQKLKNGKSPGILGQVSNQIGTYSPPSVGVYYRSEEGATALLYSQKK